MSGDGGIAQGPLGLPLSHYGYVVDDLETAVEFWTKKMNAGPFYLLGRLEADVATGEGGQPAVYTQTAAFGQWGDLPVELQQFHEISPASLQRQLDRSPINHVAYISEDAAADSRTLSGAGMPLILDGIYGPAHIRFHDCPGLGHAIELHESSDYLHGFFAGLRAAAVDWDGSEPLRDRLPGEDG